MKLVIATPLYPPEPGGPATYAKLLEDGLPGAGIDVTLVKFSAVRHLPKLFRHMAYEGKVVRALKDADAVLALDPVSVGLPAMRAAKKAGKPFFVKIVGDYAWEQGSQRFGITSSLDEFVRMSDVPFAVKVLRRIQTDVALAAKRVIVPSDYLKDIVAAWGVPKDTIQVIYNGIELPAEIPIQEKKEGEFLIVSAGRRVPWKGFEGIAAVAKKHAGWCVVIASDIPRIEVLGWIRAADVFVLNSTYEGLSHTLIEAMMLGTPVIATSAGGNGTLVTDEVTGLLIPPKNNAALDAALVRIQSDATTAAERARAGKKRMEDFTVPRMIDATATFFRANI